MRCCRIVAVVAMPLAMIACSEEVEEVAAEVETPPATVQTPPASSWGNEGSSDSDSGYGNGGGSFNDDIEAEPDDGLNEDGEPRRAEDLR